MTFAKDKRMKTDKLTKVLYIFSPFPTFSEIKRAHQCLDLLRRRACVSVSLLPLRLGGDALMRTGVGWAAGVWLSPSKARLALALISLVVWTRKSMRNSTDCVQDSSSSCPWHWYIITYVRNPYFLLELPDLANKIHGNQLN